jgi:hypothetical protein
MLPVVWSALARSSEIEDRRTAQSALTAVSAPSDLQRSSVVNTASAPLPRLSTAEASYGAPNRQNRAWESGRHDAVPSI